MKSPATQLYWKDLVTDQALGRCSWEARGAWLWVMAVLHQSDEYGVVRFSLKELANAAHVPLRLLRELSAKNVLKGGDALTENFSYSPTHAGRKLDPVVLVEASGGSCWFCKRFVIDAWVKSRRGAGSRFTSDRQPTRSPTGRMGERQGDGPASASALISLSNKRSDSSVTGAPDHARALRDAGYSECSDFVPELIEAKESGVTPAELAAVALEKPGKPIAYIVARAIGKRRDRDERAGGGVAFDPAPPDPAEVERRAELTTIESGLYDLIHQRDRLECITAAQFDERAAPLRRRRLELLSGVAA